jgi:hypothetical protein
MSLPDLADYGHCLTDVRIATSTVEGAGTGLFAAKDFKAGEVVTISPVLTLPKRVVDNSMSDSVVDYCFSSPGSDLVLFPVNYGLMINHASGANEANVAVDWYDWNPAVQALSAKYHRSEDGSGTSEIQPLKLADKLAMSVQDLFAADIAQLDIAYRATRAVRQGEELFLDYSGTWQEAWDKFRTNLPVAWSENSDASAVNKVPIFRHYVGVPSGLYQQHWGTQRHDDTEL